MDNNAHIKTTQHAASDAYYAISPNTPQEIRGRDKESWRALIDYCRYAITEDTLTGVL